MGFAPHEIQSFFDVVQNPARLEAFYGDYYVALILRSLVQASWMSSDYIPGILAPGAGTMAGTSIADLLFIVAFSA
eukprot:3744330-Karenia_brevis.AAC.1